MDESVAPGVYSHAVRDSRQHEMPSPPRRRWFRRTIVLVGVLAALALILYVLVLPMVVRNRIHAALHEAGINHVSFDLRSVTLTHLELANLDLGDTSWLKIGSVHVRYSLGSLRLGRVWSVEITGAHVQAAIDERGLVLDGRPFASDRQSTSQHPLDLPVDLIVMRDSEAVIAWQGQNLRVPIEGTLAPGADGVQHAAMLAGPASFALSGNLISFERAGFAGTVDLSDPSRPKATGEISLYNAMASIPAADLRVEGVIASLPVAWGSAAPQPAGFTVHAVSWHDRLLPGLTGSIALSEQHADVAVDWPMVPGVMLHANGWIEHAGEGIRGEIHTTLPPTQLSDAGELFASWPSLKGADITGTLSIDGLVKFTGASVVPDLQVAVQHVSANNSEWAGGIDDASASITINGFQPLSTPLDQLITIDKAHFGKLNATDGHVSFSVQNSHAVSITRAEWSQGSEGRFSTSAFVFDPADPEIRTTLSGKEVGLQPWLDLLTSGRVSGEGQLDGMIAMIIRPGRKNNVLTLSEGVLEAPAGSSGLVQLRDHSVIDRVLESADLGPDARLNQVRDRIVAALGDFKYSRLRIEFDPQADDLVCRIQTAGAGRQGDEPQEIGELNVNVHDFNTLLRAAIRGKSLYDRME